MEVTIKLFPSEFKQVPLSVQTVQFLWAADGWVYIPELRIRRRFFVTNNVTQMLQQPWEGTIPLPEHSEEVELEQYSETLWREVSEDHDQ